MIVVGFLGGATALEVARRAAATGARVEMVGVAAEGPAGDRQLLVLAASTIGHATVVRTGATGLEPADLELALRYLPEVRAIVLVDPDPVLLPTATAAAEWASASLVIVGHATLADGLPETAVALEPPPADSDGTFAGFVASLATRLDAGEPPASAFDGTVKALAVDPVRPA